MRRVSLNPDWRGPFEQWSRAFSRENFWKVQHTLLDREDAVQECGVIFAKVCKRYGTTIDNPAWFMSIYKRCVSNHFTTNHRRQEHFDWKKKRAGGKLRTISLDDPEKPIFDIAAECQHEIVDFWVSAPPEIREVFHILSREGVGEICYDLLDVPRDELDKHWLRVLDLDSKLPIVQELQLLISARICVESNITYKQEYKMATKKAKDAAKIAGAEKNKVLAELIAAIQVHDKAFAFQASDEVYSDYLKRIINAGKKITDDEFEKLPEDVQAYWNAGAKAVKGGKDIPMPPGADLRDPEAAPPGKAAKTKAPPAPEPEAEADDDAGDAAEPDGDAAEPEPEAEDAAEPEAEGDAVQGKTKKAKAPKEKKARKNLINGFSVVDMRKMVIENPEITVADLMKYAEEKGVKDIQKSTVTIARATTLTVIRLMKETGHWKD